VSVVPSMMRIIHSSQSVDELLETMVESWKGLVRHNPECLESMVKLISALEATTTIEHPAGNPGYINSPGGADASDDSARFGALGREVQEVEVASSHSYRYFGDGRTAMHCIGHSLGIATPTIPVGYQEIDLRNQAPDSLLEDLGSHLETMTLNCKKGLALFPKVESAASKMLGSGSGGEAVIKAALAFSEPISISFAALNAVMRRVVVISEGRWSRGTRKFTTPGGNTIPTHEVALNWNSPWEDDPELGYREF
jgi:hypothetical protein